MADDNIETNEPGWTGNGAAGDRQCSSRAVPGGWADGKERCVRELGHDGEHMRDALRWKVGQTVTEAPPLEQLRAVPFGELPPLLQQIFGGQPCTDPGCADCERFTPAVTEAKVPRIRLVPLANRYYDRFALVVDRTAYAAEGHDVTADAWQGFGERIGAVTTLVYPGELDIVDLA